MELVYLFSGGMYSVWFRTISSMLLYIELECGRGGLVASGDLWQGRFS